MVNTYASVCPGCGGSAIRGTNICEYCGKELFITTFTPLMNMSPPDVGKYNHSYMSPMPQETPEQKAQRLFSLGLCQIKLKLYDRARANFETVTDILYDNAEAYFYRSLCMLNGKNPYFSNIQAIKNVEDILNAAISLQQKGIYYFFAAFIKKDFYERKYFKSDKTSADLLSEANKYGIPQGDRAIVEELMGTKINL